MPHPYHHGDLPNVLRIAAAEVIEEKGVGGFSLREVARRAGVSHSAPAHHFGDTTGLLTSLAVEALNHLRNATEAAAASQTDPIERLIAIGRAYVRVGIDHPAHSQIVFRTDLVNADDPDYVEAGTQAYGRLEAALRAVADQVNPDLDIEVAAKLCWATMQGLVVLYDKMQSFDARAQRKPADPDELVTSFTRLLVDGFSVTSAASQH